jgi:cytoskeleton protein RodZ
LPKACWLRVIPYCIMNLGVAKRLRMPSIGETLRRERQRRNIQLDQVSRELKISPRFLEAIEEENFDRLPAGVFAKSFVRQYARMLGLDEDEAANEVQRALTPQDAAVPQFAASSAAQKKAPPLPEFYVPKVEAWQHVSDRRSSWSSPLAALGLVVVAMLGCSLIYGWWQRQRHPVTLAAAPAVQRRQPAPPPTNAGPDLQPAAPAPQEATTPAEPPADRSAAKAAPAAAPANATARATTAADTPAVSREPAAVKVEVTAAEDVWIMARSDGKYLFSGTLKANETRIVEAANTVLLRLGNAGGATITLNGKPIGEIGPRGQARTVQLTSGGFQIVAPKPSAPAADPI